MTGGGEENESLGACVCVAGGLKACIAGIALGGDNAS